MGMYGSDNPTVKKGKVNPSQSRPEEKNGRYYKWLDREVVTDYQSGMTATDVGKKYGILKLYTGICKKRGLPVGKDRFSNHNVISVEEGPIIDVYNGTVDDNHNYFVYVGR